MPIQKNNSSLQGQAKGEVTSPYQVLDVGHQGRSRLSYRQGTMATIRKNDLEPVNTGNSIVPLRLSLLVGYQRFTTTSVRRLS